MPPMPDKAKARIISVIFPVGLYILGALVFFRWQIFSRFDLVFGDRGDTRFVAFIHEHLYRWLAGRSELLSPPFFFDQLRTLGYSDAFLLNEFFYAPMRLLGADALLTLTLTSLILSALCYFFFFRFLRALNVSPPLAALAALIFTFPNNLYLVSVHFQLFTIYYVPVVIYCGLRAVVDLPRRPLRAYALAGFAAGLCGLLFSTGYYIAWFFGLALLIFAPVAVCLAWPEVRAWWSGQPRRVIALSAVAACSFIAALVPFAAIYAPVLALGFGRTFATYLHDAPVPSDIVNVGMANLVWSGAVRALHLIPDHRLGDVERFIALTPSVLALVLASAVVAFRPRFWPDDSVGRISRAFVIASAGVWVLLFLLVVKVGDFSLFRVLHAVMPGANAIRDGYRAMLVANLFAVTAIALTFERAIGLALQEPETFKRVGRLAGYAALLLLAAIEQVNLAQRAELSRRFEREHLASLRAASRACKSFYAADEKRFAPYEIQIDAMAIALVRHLPTVNGYSGLFPPGWDFFDTKAVDYERRVMRWAAQRGIADGLCRVDIEKGTWTRVIGNVTQ
jgi:hypothetical protein